MIWQGRHRPECGGDVRSKTFPVPRGLFVPGVTPPLRSSLPAGTWQTPAHLPHLGMHLRCGARHPGHGTSPEQEEEEIRRLPVHGWVSQASGDSGAVGAGARRALCGARLMSALGPAPWQLFGALRPGPARERLKQCWRQNGPGHSGISCVTGCVSEQREGRWTGSLEITLNPLSCSLQISSTRHKDLNVKVNIFVILKKRSPL